MELWEVGDGVSALFAVTACVPGQGRGLRALGRAASLCSGVEGADCLQPSCAVPAAAVSSNAPMGAIAPHPSAGLGPPRGAGSRLWPQQEPPAPLSAARWALLRALLQRL